MVYSERQQKQVIKGQLQQTSLVLEQMKADLDRQASHMQQLMNKQKLRYKAKLSSLKAQLRAKHFDQLCEIGKAMQIDLKLETTAREHFEFQSFNPSKTYGRKHNLKDQLLKKDLQQPSSSTFSSVQAVTRLVSALNDLSSELEQYRMCNQTSEERRGLQATPQQERFVGNNPNHSWR